MCYVLAILSKIDLEANYLGSDGMALAAIFPVLLIFFYLSIKLMTRQMVFAVFCVTILSALYFLLILKGDVDVGNYGVMEAYLGLISLVVGFFVFCVVLGIVKKTSTEVEYRRRRRLVCLFLGKWVGIYFVYSVSIKLLFSLVGAGGIAFLFLRIFGSQLFFVALFIYKCYEEFRGPGLRDASNARDKDSGWVEVVSIFLLGFVLQFSGKKIQAMHDSGNSRVLQEKHIEGAIDADTAFSRDAELPSVIGQAELHESNEKVNVSGDPLVQRVSQDTVEQINQALYGEMGRPWIDERLPSGILISKEFDYLGGYKVAVSAVNWHQNKTFVSLVLFAKDSAVEWKMISKSLRLFEMAPDYVIDESSSRLLRGRNSSFYLEFQAKKNDPSEITHGVVNFLYLIEVNPSHNHAMKMAFQEGFDAKFSRSIYFNVDNEIPMLIRLARSAEGKGYRVFPLYGAGEICSYFSDNSEVIVHDSCAAKNISIKKY